MKVTRHSVKLGVKALVFTTILATSAGSIALAEEKAEENTEEIKELIESLGEQKQALDKQQQAIQQQQQQLEEQMQKFHALQLKLKRVTGEDIVTPPSATAGSTGQAGQTSVETRGQQGQEG